MPFYLYINMYILQHLAPSVQARWNILHSRTRMARCDYSVATTISGRRAAYDEGSAGVMQANRRGGTDDEPPCPSAVPPQTNNQPINPASAYNAAFPLPALLTMPTLLQFYPPDPIYPCHTRAAPVPHCTLPTHHLHAPAVLLPWHGIFSTTCASGVSKARFMTATRSALARYAVGVADSFNQAKYWQ